MPTLPEAVFNLGADLPKIGLAETIHTAGGLLRALDYSTGNGRMSHNYNLESVNPLAGPIPINGDIPQGHIETLPAIVSYKWYGSDVPLDPRMRPMGQPIQDFEALTSEQQAKSINRLVEGHLAAGDASTDPNQFSGVRKLAHVSMTIDNGGGPLIKRTTDRAWRRLHPDARGNAAWMMAESPIIQVEEFLGAHANAAEKMAENFGQQMLTLKSRPILQSDYLELEDADGTPNVNGTCCSAYLFGMGGKGLRAVLPPDGADVFKMEKLPPVVGKPHGYLRQTFGMALVCESRFWLVRIKGILVQ